jgi:hypothetical protein
MLPARQASDHIVAVSKKGLKIELFRHKGSEPSGMASWSLPSTETLIEVVPTVLFVFLCVAFLVQKSAVCLGDLHNKTVITRVLCFSTTSFSLTPLALFLFVLTIVKQVKKTIQQKNLKKQKKS